MSTKNSLILCPNCIGMGFVFTTEDDEDCPRSPISCAMDGCTCEAPCPVCGGLAVIEENESCPDSTSR